MKVFYSWQSNLPNSCNRGLIENALQDAASRIRQDETLEVEPVIERDTQGVPGSPDIAATIFRKIDESTVFVGDVSTINRDYAGRKTPNPNVLVELGYAKKSLGIERVLTVMNTHFGPISDLPFDLAGRRVIAYSNDPDIPDRASTKRELASKFEEALRHIIRSMDVAESPGLANEPSLARNAVTAIEGAAPNRIAEVRRFMTQFVESIRGSAPDLRVEPQEANSRLLEAIPLTLDAAASFATVANAVALSGDLDTCEELCRGLERLLEGYNLPRGFSGAFQSHWFDYYRFVGHEAFTMLTAALLHEKQWNLLRHIIQRDFIVPNPYDMRQRSNSFVMFSEYVRLPMRRTDGDRTISMHAELLRERHSEGAMSTFCPLDLFCAGDYFLALRSLVAPEALPLGEKYWKPWSLMFLDDTPRFILEANRQLDAVILAAIFGITDLTTLRERLTERTPRLNGMYGTAYWEGPNIYLGGIGEDQA